MAAPDKSRFIQDITIRNFKCFEELKIEGCGQFNLILGDNNVGKTSVLEALLVEDDWDQENIVVARLQRVRLDKYGTFPTTMVGQDEPLRGLVEVFARNADAAAGFSIGIKRRGQDKRPPFIMQLKSLRELGESVKQVVRSLRIRGQHVIWMKHGEEHDGGFTPLSEPLYTGLNLPFLSLKALYGPDLIEVYSQTVTPSTAAKEEFVSALAGMIPNLTEVELTIHPLLGPAIIARLAEQDLAQPLAFFGDGSVKMARILLQIPPAANNRLMVDEIDTGIHYSRLEVLWKATLRAAIANNVQLFITTHNEECLKALAQVLETEEFAPYRAECRAFTLRRLPDGSTKSYARDLVHSMENDYEIRGGAL